MVTATGEANVGTDASPPCNAQSRINAHSVLALCKTSLILTSCWGREEEFGPAKVIRR